MFTDDSLQSHVIESSLNTTVTDWTVALSGAALSTQSVTTRTH